MMRLIADASQASGRIGIILRLPRLCASFRSLFALVMKDIILSLWIQLVPK